MLRASGLSIAALLAACSTSGKQIHLLRDDDLDQLGLAALREARRHFPVDEDPTTNQEVRCVVDALAAAAQSEGAERLPVRWEVVLLRKPTPSLFALPGGALGVNTGIFEIAKTPGELAAVIAHAMAHVVAGHANERLAIGLPSLSGMEILNAFTESGDGDKARTRSTALGLMGVDDGLGETIAFSRADENEADRIGLDLTSRAGFDPHEAMAFWQQLDAEVDPAATNFLAQHPAHGLRMKNLDERMVHAETLHDRALAAGKLPPCKLELPVARR
jgi:predicted Zn-dependent protease